MFRKITLVCALAGLLAFVVGPAFAEVQNIKVSGDIQALAVHRNNYDLEDGRNLEKTLTQVPANYLAEDGNELFMSITRLRVDADLTDNVAASVRLANLREWDNSTTTSANDIVLDLANLTLKEMLYSPLTVIIGRQELQYGNGLIVGYGLFQDPNDSIEFNDLSSLQAYDAVRAILDYDPWTLNLVLAKITEGDNLVANPTGTQTRDDDTDLYGANLGYKFNKYDAEMEGYLFYKRDENYALQLYSTNDSALNVFEDNKVYTIGLRGSAVPLENLTLGAEIAGQWGEIFDTTAYTGGNDLTRDREAMLAYASGKYDFADVRFKPTLGVEYLYLSGEKVDNTHYYSEAADKGDFNAWDPMYRGKVMGTIRDVLETLYVTNDPADTSGFTNQHTIKAKGSVDLGELVDGLSMDLAYLHYWFAEAPTPGAADDIGDEFAMKLTYDYTEDVQFFLDGAWFLPGDYYDTVHTYKVMTGGGMAAQTTATTATQRVANDTAVSILGSCKVTF